MNDYTKSLTTVEKESHHSFMNMSPKKPFVRKSFMFDKKDIETSGAEICLENLLEYV